MTRNRVSICLWETIN